MIQNDPDVTTPGSTMGATGARLHRPWRRNKLGILGLVMVVFIVIATVFGPWLLGIDPNAQDLNSRLLPIMTEGPEHLHILGTDNLGRDLLSRVLTGGRASMGVVLTALVLGSAIGVVLGMVAGFYGRWTDNVIMRLTDAQLALPVLIAAMFVAAVLGTGYWKTALTLGIATWPVYARLIRAEVLRIKEEDYTTAAIALGSTDKRLLVRHVFPNIVSSFIVVATLELGGMILTESSLSFLGFGMQPPDASWGAMIREGQTYIFADPRLSIVPGLFIMTTVLGLNLMGDWLRDVLDPHQD